MQVLAGLLRLKLLQSIQQILEMICVEFSPMLEAAALLWIIVGHKRAIHYANSHLSTRSNLRISLKIIGMSHHFGSSMTIQIQVASFKNKSRSCRAENIMPYVKDAKHAGIMYTGCIEGCCDIHIQQY